jgi:acetyl-CoA C-acetyltransferase
VVILGLFDSPGSGNMGPYVREEAFIIDAVRSPVGRRGGGLSNAHPVDLAAHALNALFARLDVDPATVDDVIMGCVDQIGAQAGNVARVAWLAAGLPETVPGTTVDRRCGSSQQALHFAAQGIMAGVQDLVVAGGVEVMTRVPLGSPVKVGAEAGMGGPYDAEGWIDRYGTQEISQFRGAEIMAERFGFERDELERFALMSHQRAAAAWDEDRFAREVVPYNGLAIDEGFRPNASLEKMAELEPLPGRTRLTAAVASQISDASAALLVASERAVREHRLTPRARVHAMSVVGADPVMMLGGPIPATRKVLDRGGLEIDDIDRFEVNEAFAPVVLAWARETDAPLERTNVNGGAIALGHPLGATGARLMTTLLCELERSGGRYGLQTMCEGGGTANSTIIERL